MRGLLGVVLVCSTLPLLAQQRLLTGDVGAHPGQGHGQSSGASAPGQPPGQSASPAVTLDDVVARIGQYVVRYGQQMEVVIGVEHYTQWMQADDYARGVSQTLVSEFALMRTGNDWSGFRDVHEVDGKPVTDRQDRLLALLRDSPATATQQARRIAQESARYNMGPMQRNFNVPTTALLFVHPDNIGRFNAKKVGEERIDDVLAWEVKFEEKRKPTLIRTSAGKDMPVTATVWVDPVDGKVLRTRMELRSEATMDVQKNLGYDPGGFGNLLKPNASTQDGVVQRVRTNATITVNYREDPRLGILVPVEMRESYLGPALSKFSGKETVAKIDCRATYSDFKRFETGGRVVKEKMPRP